MAGQTDRDNSLSTVALQRVPDTKHNRSCYCVETEAKAYSLWTAQRKTRQRGVHETPTMS